MAKKHCGHEKVCTECTKAEIAKLEKKIAILKKKLPEPQVIIKEVHVDKAWPNNIHRWPNDTMLLCVGSEYIGSGPANSPTKFNNAQYGNDTYKD